MFENSLIGFCVSSTLSFMMTFELTTVFLESRSKTPQCAEFVIKVRSEFFWYEK